ncbi:YdeI/OmpD-associated family protein [Mesorhizobium sp. M0018]
MTAFEQRPPYQRNDYLHWIERARHPETRRKRINQMIDELTKGESTWECNKSWHRREASRSVNDHLPIHGLSRSGAFRIDLHRFPTFCAEDAESQIVTIEPILHFRLRQVAI